MEPKVTDVTPQQQQAIELFARGQPVGTIAEALGIGRKTLWQWRQQPHFMAALQQRRAQQYDFMREQSNELIRLALLSIERELKLAEDPKMCNPLDAAFKLLRFASTHGLMQEVPPRETMTALPADC